MLSPEVVSSRSILGRFCRSWAVLRGQHGTQRPLSAAPQGPCRYSSQADQSSDASPSSNDEGNTLQRPTTPIKPAIKWEPLDVGLPPDVTPYQSLSFELKAYDYVPLEKFARYVHNMCSSLGHDSDAFAMPAKSVRVSTYRPQSTVIDNTYDLQLYERNIEVRDLTNTALEPLISLLACHLPEGVTLRVRHHTADDEQDRYIPDRALRELQEQLDEMGGASKKKRR
ncbi:39S ribosomal protein L48, mitochondrial-like [Argonauta hians]